MKKMVEVEMKEKVDGESGGHLLHRCGGVSIAIVFIMGVEYPYSYSIYDGVLLHHGSRSRSILNNSEKQGERFHWLTRRAFGLGEFRFNIAA